MAALVDTGRPQTPRLALRMSAEQSQAWHVLKIVEQRQQHRSDITWAANDLWYFGRSCVVDELKQIANGDAEVPAQIIQRVDIYPIGGFLIKKSNGISV